MEVHDLRRRPADAAQQQQQQQQQQPARSTQIDFFWRRVHELGLLDVERTVRPSQPSTKCCWRLEQSLTPPRDPDLL